MVVMLLVLVMMMMLTDIRNFAVISINLQSCGKNLHVPMTRTGWFGLLDLP